MNLETVKTDGINNMRKPSETAPLQYLFTFKRYLEHFRLLKKRILKGGGRATRITMVLGNAFEHETDIE